MIEDPSKPALPPAPPVQSHEEKDTFLSRTLKVVAYPISALIGYTFAKPMIRNAAYDNLKRYDAFKDIRPTHHAKQKELIERFQKGEPVDVLRETVKLQDHYQAQVTDRLAELGLGTIDKQWRFIHKSQQQNALMAGFTAGAIAIGATLAIANNKTLSSLKEDEKDLGV